jgi:hypothetical protein
VTIPVFTNGRHTLRKPKEQRDSPFKMIVPSYWAEASRVHKARRKPITIRRFGWSDLSLEDAQAMADTRADDALARALSGEAIHRREKKAAYNGADGAPIREEVLSRHGDVVITRNSYGAHCLNTPNVLFADVDIDTGFSALTTAGISLAMAIAGVLLGQFFSSLAMSALLALLALFVGYFVSHAVQWAMLQRNGGHEGRAIDRLQSFLLKQPSWSVRIYRTPAGLRLLATQQLFDPVQEDVQHFFVAMDADPIYVRMCRNQRCFRARLTAKPWRIGIESHMRPRPGVWPIDPSQMPQRNAWVAEYEAKAKSFSACQYLQTLGSGLIHIDVQATVDLHDAETRALQQGVLQLA